MTLILPYAETMVDRQTTVQGEGDGEALDDGKEGVRHMW